jgi:hypothetical protein
MSKPILAVILPDYDFDTFKRRAKDYNFIVENYTSEIGQEVIVILKADYSTEIYHLSNYPLFGNIEMIKYRGCFRMDVYPRFKKLLLQSTIVKPKLTKKDLQDVKIWIGDNPELNKKVQDVLYSLGFSWLISEKYSHLESKYLTTNKKNICFGSGRNFYNECKQKEVLISDILDKEPVKEYKVSEEFILEAHKAACSIWKSKLEKQFPDVLLKTYNAGSRWMDDNDEECMLVRTDAKMFTLICCSSGNRYKAPIKVENNEAVTESELRKMANYFDDFKLIVKK